MSQQLRVLILADDCNPDWPSLPVVGYKAARALADHAEVTVATHVRNRAQVDRDGIGKARVVYLDNEYIASPLFKLGKIIRGGQDAGWTTKIALTYPSYLAFEWEAWKKFKKQLKSGEFDVVHRLTPMSPTLASPMARWSPVPFVLGPLNGGLKWPRQFQGERAKEKEWLLKVRNAYRLLPYYRCTYRRSAAILTAFKHTIDDLPAAARDRMIDFPEVGVDPHVFAADTERAADPQRMTFLFAGRLTPLKLANVAVEAFARSQKLRRHRLVIVGEGTESQPLRDQIEKHKLEECVQMVGWKTQQEVGQLMREADVFVFPSIRDLGAGAVAEAMACGLCCAVVDYGGPGGLIEPDRGVKVPMGTQAQITDNFLAALEALADDPQRVRRLGDAARAYALGHLTWDVKARKTIEIYRWAMGQREQRPDFHNAGELA